MRSGRNLVAMVGLGLMLGLLAACTRAEPAHAAGAWIEATPSPVAAGSTVNLRATCVNDTTSAKVVSIAFGTVTVRPGTGGVLVAQVRVPTRTREGTYQVTLTCPNGSTATTSVLVLSSSQPAMSTGPHTGGGFLANGGAGGSARGGADVWLWAAGVALILAAAVALHSRRRANPPTHHPPALHPPTHRRAPGPAR
jgi:hypothetical protein